MQRMALCAVISALLVGCGQKPASAPKVGNYTIVATTGMIADIVMAVVGDRASVTTLMREGVGSARTADRHTWPVSRHTTEVATDVCGCLECRFLVGCRIVGQHWAHHVVDPFIESAAEEEHLPKPHRSQQHPRLSPVRSTPRVEDDGF